MPIKASQKLDLISQIGRELQSRYTYQEIDSYLIEFGIQPPQNVSANSKWVYTKEALRGVPEKVLFEIASDLEISAKESKLKATTPPKCWADGQTFRLFLSHVSTHKALAHRLKETLAAYNITAFVAHDDIEPTKQWQGEIEKGLDKMDAMLTLHTKGFSKSVWTQQEVGYALGRDALVIAYMHEPSENPAGFISKNQAVLRRNRNAEQIAEEIYQLLSSDPLTSARMQEVQKSHQKIEDDIPF